MYISHDAENLQFWLWYEDYSCRFFATSKSEQALSPPWYKAEVPRPHSNDSNQTGATVFEREKPHITGGVMIQELHTDHNHRPSSPSFSHGDTQSLASTTSTTLHAESIEDVDTQMGLKCKPCKLSSSRSTFTLLSLRSRRSAVSFRDQSCHLALPQSWLEQGA